MEKLFEIIHEDENLLVVNKPADLVCHPTKGDVYSSLISRVRLHLGDAVRPQLINRLDRETSGIVVVAKNDSTALELRRVWENRAVEKTYLAIVTGGVTAASGTIDVPLGRDERSVVAIKDTVRADGSPARTDFETLRRFTRAEGDYSLLRVRPLTGRKHQIRIHLAHYGHPIVGDKLYGGDETLYLDFVEKRLSATRRQSLLLSNQALHASAVRWVWRERDIYLTAEPEASFAEFARSGETVHTARASGTHVIPSPPASAPFIV